jgi:hypothetical protein
MDGRLDGGSIERIEIATVSGDTAFRPGDVLAGRVSWQLAEAPESAEVRLFWYTAGRGTQDVGVVSTVPLAAPAAEDRRDFELRLPDGPYSFSGRLISLLWAVEVVLQPGPRAGRLELVLSPTGQEIVLATALPAVS